MAARNSMEMAALQVLSWQTPGYLCSTDASAFISQGLENPSQIEIALMALEKEGLVEFYIDEEEIDVIKVKKDRLGEPERDEETGGVIPLVDEDGNLQFETVKKFLDSGWIITDEGRALVA